MLGTEETRSESVIAAGRKYLGKGIRQGQANGDSFAAHSPSSLRLRDFQTVSLHLVALQRAFLSGAENSTKR